MLECCVIDSRCPWEKRWSRGFSFVLNFYMSHLQLHKRWKRSKKPKKTTKPGRQVTGELLAHVYLFLLFCSLSQSSELGCQGYWRTYTQVHHDLLSLRLCHVTMLLHKRHTCSHNRLAGATPQVLEFQGIQGLPYKIPNEIPNALSHPLLNRKQAST